MAGLAPITDEAARTGFIQIGGGARKSRRHVFAREILIMQKFTAAALFGAALLALPAPALAQEAWAFQA